MNKHLTDYRAGILLAFLASLLWSGNYIIARGLSRDISPVSLAFLRWCTATLILLPIAYKTVRRDWTLLKANWKLLSLTAILGVTLFNTFIYVAGKYSSAINLAIIGTTFSPMFVLIVAHFVLKERATKYQVLGMLVCFAGVVVLITDGSPKALADFQFTPGDFWILLAALAFALYTLLVRKKPPAIASLSYLFALFSLGTVGLFPLFIADSWQGLTFIPTPSLLLVFLYLGAGASVGAFLSWNIAIQKMGAGRTALFAILIPVFSSIEAALLLGEKTTSALYISLAFIIAGLLLANFGQLKRGRVAAQ
ncbi:MAG: DMT family transporter [Chitinophagaceae bacterium]